MADYHVGGKHYNNKMNQSRITNLLGRQLLLARRLCEAGCGFVTVVDGGWDLHGDGNNPNTPEGMAILGPQLDHAVAAFLDDVQRAGPQRADPARHHRRNGAHADQNLRCAKGEGATSFGGTGHWKDVTPLVFAGGGLKMGQVIGQTDRTASRAVDRALTPPPTCSPRCCTLCSTPARPGSRPKLLPAEISEAGRRRNADRWAFVTWFGISYQRWP